MTFKCRPAIVALGMVSLFGCTPNKQRYDSSVTQRLQVESSSAASERPASPTVGAAAEQAPALREGEVVAWVNEQPVFQRDFEDLLMRGHGRSVLEQLVLTEVVRQQARSRGISVSAGDIQAEYDRAVVELAGFVAEQTDPTTQRSLGEQVLKRFLLDKNISEQEYMLGMERNALLRRLVPAVEVGEEDVQSEVLRRFGPQAVVRHMALPNVRSVSQVRRRLDAGEDFGRLAREVSANRSSAAQGGLLPPFTRHDLAVPAVMREIVFGLRPGQVSETTKIEGQFHLFKVESFNDRIVPPMTAELRRECRSLVERRQIREGMRDLERVMRRQADVRIEDARLRGGDAGG